MILNMNSIDARSVYIKQIENEIRNVVSGGGVSSGWTESDIYFVGGFVRDSLLPDFDMVSFPKDVDMVIDCPGGASKFVEFLKKTIPDRISGVVEYSKFGTAKFDFEYQDSILCSHTIQIECVEPRKEEYKDGPRKPSSVQYASIKEDAMRRDFCCNALYKNVITGKILDPTGHGHEDVQNKILRTPRDPEETYKDDPLRMLRAIRFAATKGFEIEEETFRAIKPIPEYYNLSMERVNSEFTKILMSDNPRKYIWDLHETGLLKYIIPELEEAWGFNQNSKYHSMNLTDHMFSVLDLTVESLKKAVDTTYSLHLRLAAILHDISKYKIHETKADGTFSYHNHEVYSAEMAENILKRLKYPSDVIKIVSSLIKDHMIIKSQYNYETKAYTGNDKSVRKYLNKIGYLVAGKVSPDRRQYLQALHTLIDADNNSHAPEWNMPGQISSLNTKIADFILAKKHLNGAKCIVSGKDIMDRFNLRPGKAVGYLKEKIIEDIFIVDNPSSTKEDLLNMVEAEFGDKTIYIWPITWAGDVAASLRKPDESYIPGNGRVGLTKYTVLDPSEKHLLDDGVGKYRALRAIEYPELFVRIKTRGRARELMLEATDALNKLNELPGFERARMTFDKYGDAEAITAWTDHSDDSLF